MYMRFALTQPALPFTINYDDVQLINCIAPKQFTMWGTFNPYRVRLNAMRFVLLYERIASRTLLDRLMYTGDRKIVREIIHWSAISDCSNEITSIYNKWPKEFPSN